MWPGVPGLTPAPEERGLPFPSSLTLGTPAMQQAGGSGGGDQFPQGPLPAKGTESQQCEETWVSGSTSCALTLITFIPLRPKSNTN